MRGAAPLISLFSINLFSKGYGINDSIRMENSSQEEIPSSWYSSNNETVESYFEETRAIP